eukprot:4394577-Pleurochrysis_carterae.AAC.2
MITTPVYEQVCDGNDDYDIATPAITQAAFDDMKKVILGSSLATAQLCKSSSIAVGDDQVARPSDHAQVPRCEVQSAQGEGFHGAHRRAAHPA